MDSYRWLLRARDDHATLGRRPLGEREQVAALLAETLPRLAFDGGGKGIYARGKAELRLQLAGRPVTAVELTMRAEHVGAFRPALERIATKAGWQLFDPDRGEVVFPVESAPPSRSPDGGRGTLPWVFAALLAGAGIAGWNGWIPIGSGNGAAARLSGAASEEPETPLLPEGPKSPEAIAAQAQLLAEFLRRQQSVSPEFLRMQVVNEMLMIGAAEKQFRAAAGRYVDPAMLADRSVGRPGGVPFLPAAFVAPSRGGYRFTFSGDDEGEGLLPQFRPAYASFAYVASPEPGERGGHTFALLSETGLIHYTTDGRVPTADDPSVTAAGEAKDRLQ